MPRRLQKLLAAALAAASLFVVGAGTSPSGAARAPGSPAVEGSAAARVDGVDPERLARLGAYFDGVITRNLLPGNLNLVAHDGVIVDVDVAGGWLDAAKTVPIQRDSLFRMYSMTKPITSVAVLMLMEEGRLLLTDPVARYIPAFADVKVQAEGGELVAPARPITIRDLLTHTSGTLGLAELIANPGLVQLDAVTPMSELVDRIAALPLRFQPGTRFDYGFGQDIAGVVVENISGQTLDAFLRSRIFEPLGMGDTSFYVPAEKAGRLVPEFGPLPQGSSWTWTPLPPAPFSSDKVGQPQVQFGGGGWGGGVVSTIDDYFRFAQMLANEGELDGARILSRKSVELMTTSHTGDLPTLAGPGYGFGLGVSVRTDLTSRPVVGSVGRFGWSGAGFTYFFVDPTERLVAIRFANVLGIEALPGVGDINPTFDTLVYQALT